ncbi:WecB/TagA/CpsF family glycosyltransferase [Paenibacillus glycanilyticus]|uniref:WecB/TagA/CpsF family glycosyltransferase n=1 Tax=Paenibacillus glycanilyticus TaxID=126569 RepID=UPI00203B2E06|nr:WecB/TagA/CpsF family glycosyltransferase [Paenibacillus glycanilyticus]MCM3630338.1 WecB/TagA/CpsF family glycosyltransferase [Paenibacillus glycanilyticus]
MESNKVELFGVAFDNLTMTAALEEVDKLVVINRNNNTSSFIVTPNVDHLVNLNKDRLFKEVYEKASLRFVDGMPIVLLSKLFKKPLKEKISGADLTPKLIEMAYHKKYKVFIFGSKPGVAEAVANKYSKNYDNQIQISTYSPPFGFEKQEDELKKCLGIINEFKPDILLVSLGSPKGELFISQNLKILNVPVCMQVGAAIDFMAGTVKRAPLWMQKVGLEWFYRFLMEPKRMFKRYFVNDVYFFRLIIDEMFRK